MAESFKTKQRGEMLRYSRPNISTYEDSLGNTVTSVPNAPRFEYKDGYPYGLKMGDGDKASIPLTTNTIWPLDGETGTVVATYNAPLNNLFVKCGDVELTGHGCMKTVIVDVAATDVLEDAVNIAPNSDNFTDGESHLLTFKYYGEAIDFSAYTEHEAMEELNTFVHGDWS